MSSKHDKSHGQPPLRSTLAAILDAFKSCGIGIAVTLETLRSKLPQDLGSQEELTRRIRDLRAHGYGITYAKANQTYTLVSEQTVRKKADTTAIPSRLAARIRLLAHGRCQMCGETIAEDGIKLVVDHRVPRDWGGSSEDPDNLWAICEPCNISKQAFFATLPNSVMEKCMSPKESIIRLGELLKALEGTAVSRDLLEVVGRDDEWTRRLRELRDLGWSITSVPTKGRNGRTRYDYRLEPSTWKPWPADIGQALKLAAASRKSNRSDSE